MFRSTVELLANHLRDEIAHGQIVEPLPNTRDWARQLEVSRNTLCAALKTLEREGAVKRRGIRGTKGFQLASVRVVVGSDSTPNTVRFIDYRPDLRGHHNAGTSMVSHLAERLHQHDIELRLEHWSEVQARMIDCLRSEPNRAKRELLLVTGFLPEHLTLFARTGRACLMTGTALPGLDLPSVWCDFVGAVRHATFYLARRGFRRITFLLRETRSPHVQEYCEAFLSACQQSAHAGARGEILRPKLDRDSQVAEATRLATRIKEPMGIILAGPLSVSVLMTVLLRHGIRIPQDAQIVMTNSLPEVLMVEPQPAHYPFPLDAIVKTIAGLAIRYFKTGKLPRVHKLLPVEMVKP